MSLDVFQDRVQRKVAGIVTLPISYHCPSSGKQLVLTSVQELRDAYTAMTAACPSTTSLMPMQRITLHVVTRSPPAISEEQQQQRQSPSRDAASAAEQQEQRSSPACLHLDRPPSTCSSSSGGGGGGSDSELDSEAWEQHLIANILLAVRKHDFTPRGRAASFDVQLPPPQQARPPVQRTTSGTVLLGAGGSSVQQTCRRHMVGDGASTPVRASQA